MTCIDAWLWTDPTGMVTLKDPIVPVAPVAVKLRAVPLNARLVTVASLLTEHELVPHVVLVVWVTSTVTVVEVTVTGVPALSVTCSSKVQIPVVVNAPVEVDVGDVHATAVPRLLKVIAPGAFCSHWHE